MKNSCLGVLLVFLLMIFFSITTLLFVYDFTFLNTNFYKKQLEKVDFYNKGAEVFVDIFETESQGLKITDQVTQSHFKSAIKSTITPIFLKEEIEKVLTGARSFLRLKTDILELEFDMERLRGDFEQNLYQEFTKDRPMTWAQYQSSVYNQVKPEINQVFKKYSLSEAIEKDPVGITTSLSQTQRVLKTILVIRYLSLGLTILLLAAIILLTRKDIGAVLRWTGWGVGLSGLILVILSFIFRPILGFVREQAFAGFSDLEFSGSLIVDLVNEVFGSAAGALLWVSLIIFVLGLGIIIISYLIKGSNSNSTPGSGSKDSTGGSRVSQKPKTSPVASAIAAARK